MPPPQLAPPGMPPSMPPQMMPGQGGMNPSGGGEMPLCPCCGQPMPMPFNNTNAPNAPLPMPPQAMGGGQMNPQDSQLLMALLGGGGASGGGGMPPMY